MSPLVEEIKKQEVIDQLTWDNSINANEVIVKVFDGTVQLEGAVPNYVSKVTAAMDAYLVPGVKHVDNFLDVKYPPTTSLPDDAQITNNVSNILMWNSSLTSANIEVETNSRMVTLKGSVPTFWEKHKAEDLANESFGVMGVINLLDVHLAEETTDDHIKSQITDYFKKSILIDENKIDVSVKNGQVTLTGIVSGYIIKREAVRSAIYTKGVVEVIDEITIG